MHSQLGPSRTARGSSRLASAMQKFLLNTHSLNDLLLEFTRQSTMS